MTIAAEFNAYKNNVVSKPLLNSGQKDRVNGARNSIEDSHAAERETWAGKSHVN